jgi:hypothetical protein
LKACKSKERKSAKKRRPEDDDEAGSAPPPLLGGPIDVMASGVNTDTLNQYREEYRKFRMSANGEDANGGGEGGDPEEEGEKLVVAEDDDSRLLSGLALEGMPACKKNKPARCSATAAHSRSLAKNSEIPDPAAQTAAGLGELKAEGGEANTSGHYAAEADAGSCVMVTWTGAGGDHSSADLVSAS